MKSKKIALVLLLAALLGGVWWATRGTQPDAAGAPGAGAKGGSGKGEQPATVVNVIAPLRQDVPVVLTATGSVVPVSSVVLHPQTTSTIRKVHIREGQFVKAGELMFTLDDRSERANVDKAEAQIAREKAALADLERQYARSQQLFAQKFIAQGALDSLKAQVDAARAAQGASMAALQAEKVAASYSAIRAPQGGRVGAIDVYPGSLVQPATALTSITQLDPIEVAFTLPEASLADLLVAQRQGALAVQATTGAGAGKPVTGTLSFIDNAVDPQAGTIRVKARFANRDNALWPGQYATASVTLQTIKDALVIPQNAIITSPRGTSVYVIEDGAAAARPVRRLHAFGQQAAVSGLQGNEQVITEGKQNLRPGGKVKLAAASPAAPAASATATAAK